VHIAPNVPVPSLRRTRFLSTALSYEELLLNDVTHPRSLFEFATDGAIDEPVQQGRKLVDAFGALANWRTQRDRDHLKFVASQLAGASPVAEIMSIELCVDPG
jgi:hypothetical protein